MGAWGLNGGWGGLTGEARTDETVGTRGLNGEGSLVR